MATIDWQTMSFEPAPHGAGAQLSVDVRGAETVWAQRFNELAEGQFRRGEVRGGRWGLIRYHEVDGLITVDDLYGDDVEPIRLNLEDLVRKASG